MPVNYANGSIYKMVNSINNTIYIGSTTCKLSARKGGHVRDSKNLNSTSAWLTAMRTLGATNFRVVLIHAFPCTSKEELEAEEYRVLDACIAAGTPVYNTKIQGKPNQEVRDKMAAAHVGKKHPDAVKAKIAQSRKGVKFTDEHKRNLSQAKKGQGFSFGCLGYYEGDYPRWLFQYYDKQGVNHAKSFSIRKFGNYGAHFRAEELRKQIYPEYGTEEDVACDDLGHIEWD